MTGSPVRGGVARVAGYGATVALGVAGTAILLHHLGVRRSGHYFQAVAVIALVQALSDPGLTVLGLREAAIQPSRRAFLRSLLTLRLLLAAIGVLAGLAFGWAVGFPGAVVGGIALAGLGLVVQTAQLTLTIPLQADGRQGAVAGADVLRQAVLVVVFAVLAGAGAGISWFLAAAIPAAAASWALTARAVRRERVATPAAGRIVLLTLLRRAAPYAVAVGAQAVYFRISLLAISLVGTAVETGEYGASFRVVEVLTVVPGLVGVVALPELARHAAGADAAASRRALLRLLRVSVAVGGALFAVLLAAAPLIVRLVAGNGFGAATGSLRIQAISLLLSCAGLPFGFLLLARDRARTLAVVNLVGLAAGAAAAFPLAAADGPSGAALATVVGEVVMTAGALAAAWPSVRGASRDTGSPGAGGGRTGRSP